MTEGLLIRPMLPADASAVARIYCQAASEAFAREPSHFRVPELDAVAQEYQARAKIESAVVLVGEWDGAVLGFVDIKLNRRDPSSMRRCELIAYVQELAVAEGHRSQGVGKQLMEAAEAWARERGADALLLDTGTTNEGAIRFYEVKMAGYRRIGLVYIKEFDASGG